MQTCVHGQSVTEISLLSSVAAATTFCLQCQLAGTATLTHTRQSMNHDEECTWHLQSERQPLQPAWQPSRCPELPCVQAASKVWCGSLCTVKGRATQELARQAAEEKQG